MSGRIVVLPEAFLAREEHLRQRAQRGWFEDEDIALCLAEIDRLRTIIDLSRTDLERPHIPGTDYYDGRDGSLEADEA